MSVKTIHQIWIKNEPLPESAEKVRQFAAVNNIHYMVWTWEMLREKFGPYNFEPAPGRVPESRLHRYVIQFYSMLILAEAECAVVSTTAVVPEAILNIIPETEVVLNGSKINPAMDVMCVLNKTAGALIRNSVLAQYERNKDLFAFASEALTTSLIGTNFLQRVLIPCLQYNHIKYAFLTDMAMVLQSKLPAIPARLQTTAKEEQAQDNSSNAPAAVIVSQEAGKMAATVEVLPPFWLPKNTARIVIIADDATDLDNYTWEVGDCIVHMNDAVFAETLALRTAASHILFVDVYPRSRMKTPRTFKTYRNIVFYDKRIQSEWKKHFVQVTGRMPSLLCCLVTEFRRLYPTLPIQVLGGTLSQRSIYAEEHDRTAEELWLESQNCVFLGNVYKCVFLLVHTRADSKGIKAQEATWLGTLPKQCMYRFVTTKGVDDMGANVFRETRTIEDPLGIKAAVTKLLKWHWEYLFIGTDSMLVNAMALLQEINKGETAGGHARVMYGNPYWMLQAGFFVAREAVLRIADGNYTLDSLQGLATLEQTRSDFAPFDTYKKEGINYISVGSLSPEVIASRGAQ